MKTTMKKSSVRGGQLVTNTKDIQVNSGNSQGTGYVTSNPTPVTMGVGKGGSKGKGTARKSRKRQY